MVLATAALGLHSSLLAIGVPLWISVTHLVPAWMVPVLIGLNTILVVLLQVSAAGRAGRSFGSAVAASRVAGIVGAAACVVLAASVWRHSHAIAATTLVLGFVLLTLVDFCRMVRSSISASTLDRMISARRRVAGRDRTARLSQNRA